MRSLIPAATLVLLCSFALATGPARAASPPALHAAVAPTDPSTAAKQASSGTKSLADQRCRGAAQDNAVARRRCLPFAGNVYTRAEIQRTHAARLGQAMQMLDPAITMRGH